MPQILKISKAVIKTSLKSKDDTEKSNSDSILSDSSSETVIKHIYQNQTSAKNDFAEWLRVSNHKLHKLILWDFKENTKEQKLQRRLFKRNISFMIEILRENVKSKVRLFMSLIKIKKHYSFAYVMCQTLMSATNMEIPFTDWDTLFKLMINKHENGIQHNL